MVFEPTDDPHRDLQRLIDHTFPDIRQRYQEPQYFASRAILTPKNADVEAINNKVLQAVPGQVETYLSVDTIDKDDTDGALHLTDEFLHSLKLGGLPPHELRLKVGTPIILIRNLSTRNGLCNGTRLRVLALRPHYILAKVITGPNEGQEALLPRINCDSSESALPSTLRRRQFPVQIAFAMTINKAQGRTMNHMGLYLP
jgi:ATP-dependent DNA helicase PIF1